MKKEQNTLKSEIISQKIDVFNDINYICKSTQLITSCLQKGCDVTQMSNGDIIITEVKTLHTFYNWDPSTSKMIKSGKKN